MPKRLLIVLVTAVYLTGCTSTTTNKNLNTTVNVNSDSGITYSTVNTDSDFTLPLGRADNPPPASAGERRLLLAHSTDGIHFTASGEVLTDQGNVPDLIVESDGTILVYYIGQSIEVGKEENTVVAVSEDQGVTWTFHKLTYINWPSPRDPSDPDVVLLDDGTYRMYYTDSISSTKIGIVYATSSDGITFTYQGLAFENTIGNANDSSTFYFNGIWHMYVLQEQLNNQLHATSTDGILFSLTDQPEVRLPLNGYIISNPLIEDDTLRMFGFNLQDKNIRSFTSTDGATWVDGEVALEGDEAATLGSNYIQDSTVAKLSDGSYLMVYVSEIPVE